MGEERAEADADDLRRELRFVDGIADWARAELYGVRQGGYRAEAVTAVAASAAAETYRLTDRMPQWQNETSASWRRNLERVWAFLEGDRSQYYALSRAVAGYLAGPLNHNEGQDGPDDFDRPQTIAAYSAALSVTAWGVDFAVTAIEQIFEAIDLKYESEGGDADERWSEVQREAEFVRRVITTVTQSRREALAGFPPEVLSSIRV